MNGRPNRWQAARDPHLGAMRVRAVSAPKRAPVGWSLPATRALKAAGWIMVAAVAWSCRSDLLALWPL